MKIYHRIDDIQEYSEDYRRILDFFEDNTKDFIVAAIPYGFSEKYKEIMKNYQHCIVYQHGYEHYNRVPKGWCDEFPDDMPDEDKERLIKIGKENLESILDLKIIGYVPPWNNTGEHTIQILKKLGFVIYSSQENNTYKFEANKDICIDIVNKYVPKIEYKDLNNVYKEILELSHIKEEIGIMYHFKNTSDDDFSKICNFIRRVEKLNT